MTSVRLTKTHKAKLCEIDNGNGTWNPYYYRPRPVASAKSPDVSSKWISLGLVTVRLTLAGLQ